MEGFCSKLLSIMKLEILNYMIVVVLCIVAIIICALLRNDKKYNILFWISCVCLIITIVLFTNDIVPMQKDYRNKSFVQLEDARIVSSPLGRFDLSGIGEVSVCTASGETFKLKTTEQSFDNVCRINLVYSKKSRYLVYWEKTE